MPVARKAAVRIGVAEAFHLLFLLICKGDLRVEDLSHLDAGSPELPLQLAMLAGQRGLSIEVI